jgi:hypothetical protein
MILQLDGTELSKASLFKMERMLGGLELRIFMTMAKKNSLDQLILFDKRRTIIKFKEALVKSRPLFFMNGIAFVIH